jgi:outer membrane murein-binding lipoprotein Lpp
MKSLPLFLSLLVASCVSRAPKQEVSAQAQPVGTPVLYGRDGAPVWTSEAGGTQIRKGPTGEAIADGSRVYLLELYQQVIDEKERLGIEVKSLTASLERLQADLKSNTEKLEQSSAENARLQGELERSRLENLELAGRLVTAQIRRLEAEKLLLEYKIEAARLAAQPNPDAITKPVPRQENP